MKENDEKYTWVIARNREYERKEKTKIKDKEEEGVVYIGNVASTFGGG